MENLIASTAEAVQKAADALNRVRPAYKQVIQYYRQVFDAQETTKAAMNLTEIEIPRDRLVQQAENGFPLITPAEFQIAPDASAELMEKICEITESADIQTSPDAGRLKAALNSGKTDSSVLFSDFFKPGASEIDALAEQLNIDSRFLRIILYHSLRPAIETGSAQLKTLLPKQADTETRLCPVCGSQPVLATMGASGERLHFCGLCWHEWPFHRASCSFCDEKKENSLAYFYSETEKEYRTDICETCRTYMKCIDLREISRIIYPPLELAATIHLDLKAQEAGYQGPAHFIY